MIRLKTPKDIAILREGGKRHAVILEQVLKKVTPGVTAKELDDYAFALIREGNDMPAFLDYKPYGANRPYPATLCVSVNDEVVHGIPNEASKILKEGDIVSVDLGLVHNGLITDMAITVGVGSIDRAAKQLIECTKLSLQKGIEAIIPGATIGDIGFAVERFVEPTGLSLAKGLSGHGVGYAVHEDPYIPNTGKKGQGEKLVPGMVIAIEPMVNEGSGKVILDSDGYTYKTADGKRSAHFEHTILVTEEGYEILTQ